MRALIEADFRTITRLDSFFDDLTTRLMASLRGIAERRRTIVRSIASRFGFRTSEANYTKYSKKIYDGMGINQINTKPLQDDWISSNVRFIGNATQKELVAIENLIRTNFYSGNSYSTLVEGLNKIFKSGRSNVAFIAKDQINKLSGQMDRYKQTQAGISKYIWRIIDDGRARPKHKARNGKVFSWDNPPEGGHPKEAPGCRCDAEPYIEIKNGKTTEK